MENPPRVRVRGRFLDRRLTGRQAPIAWDVPSLVAPRGAPGPGDDPDAGGDRNLAADLLKGQPGYQQLPLAPMVWTNVDQPGRLGPNGLRSDARIGGGPSLLTMPGCEGCTPPVTCRRVRSGRGPGAWRRCPDPQHVLRRKQDPSVGTTSLKVGRPTPLFLPGRLAEPVLAPGAVADSMPQVKRGEAPATCL